jgi:hypothetical protein
MAPWAGQVFLLSSGCLQALIWEAWSFKQVKVSYFSG